MHRLAQLSLFSLALLMTPVSAQPSEDIQLESRDAKPFGLRVMALGASITYGYRSTDGNGYRNWLREDLVNEGWEVDMVGSIQHGKMKDNNVEATPGYRISQVAGLAEKGIPDAPNLILINAGTNDAVQNKSTETVETAGQRMDKLLTRLYDTIPGTTVILSTLLPNLNETVQDNVDDINAQFRDIVKTRRGKKDRIVLAEMTGAIKKDDIHTDDGTHPLDEGYKKMAAAWYKAFQDVESQKLLQKPKDLGK